MKINNINKNGLVGYWSLAEDDLNNAGDIIKDKSGNGNDGMIAVTPASFEKDQNGVPNQAIKMQYTISPTISTTPINIGTYYTLNYWIKFTEISTSGAVTLMSNNSSSDYLVTHAFWNSTNKVYHKPSGVANFWDTSILPNKWYHMSLVRQNTNLELFMDGVSVGHTIMNSNPSASFEKIILSISSFTTEAPIYISDIAIYNRALSTQEVQQLYKAGRTTAKVKVNAKNLVTNGTFDTDSDWSKGAGWTIDNGKASYVEGVAGNLKQTGYNLELGRTYELTMFIESTTTPRIAIYCYDDSSAYFPNQIVDTGYFNLKITPTSTLNGISIWGWNNGDFSIDNVSIVDITSKVTPKLQKGLILDMPLADPYTEAGDNLITNGDFDTDSDWTKGTGWSINTTTKTAVATSVAVNNINQNVGFVKGKTYNISFDVVKTSGTLRLFAGGINGVDVVDTDIPTGHYSTNHTIPQTGSGGGYLYIYGTASPNEFTGTIDNVIAKELDGTTKDRTPNGNDGTVNGATVKYDGLVNTADGIAYIPSNTAYGAWEFNINKKFDENAIRTYFINNKNIVDISPPVSSGYYFYIHTGESLYFVKCTDGESNNVLWKTGIDYIDINTDYRIKITRSLAGLFTVYIKGGSFGWNDWTLVDTSGGSGSNPVTDNTYTTSNYFVTDLDAGDAVSNLKINGKKVSLNKATVNSGSFTTTAPSYYFDGVDDDITPETEINILDNKPWTISFWINPNMTSFISILGDKVSTGEYWRIYGNVSAEYFRVSDKNNYDVEWSHTWTSGWQHWVVTCNGTNTSNIETFLEGVTLGTKTLADTGVVLRKIGQLGNDTNYFDGQISNLKIWNRVLDASEINYLYNREKINY